MEIADLVAQERTIPVKYAGNEFNITYRVGEIVPTFWDWYDAARETDYNHRLAILAERLIVKWDLVDQGVMVPTDRKTVAAKVPWPVLNEIKSAIFQDTFSGNASASS
ncbi:MAG TPA: hypothetical protein VGE07_01490 [Herpetosiphonaceae bacterium]